MNTWGDFETSPELEAQADELARRARTDCAARDSLYQLLAVKIEKFVRPARFRAYRSRAYEPDDVGQEAFLTFCDLIERWPGDRSFLGYFFSRFSWRLSRRLQNIERHWPIGRFMSSDTAIDDRPAPMDLLLLLIDIGATLKPRDRTVLYLHAGCDLSIAETARILGYTRETISRDWSRIRASAA